MKNTSTEFNTIAENPFGAKYIHKIIDLTNNTEIKDDIDDFLYSAMINDDDVFTIGNTCSATISFSIINPTVNINNKEIEVYQGLDINGTVEYVKLGVFKVLKPKKDRNITRYQCVDRMTYLMNMPYSSNLTFPTTDVKILEEICTQVGITLIKNGLISHSISKSPSGYTKREIIAYMSQLQGKNARINSDGKLELIWYTDTGYVVDDNKIYYDGTSDVNSEIDYKVEYLECTVRSLDGTDETVINAGSGTNGIKIENPFMTQTILYELANKLVGFTFRGAEFEFLGDFRLEVGDIVSVETNGEVYRVPIMQIEHKSDGGVVTTITSIGETDTENEIDLSSPNVNAMDRYYADLVLINKAMINKLSVDEADIKYLKVTQLEGIEANIENAVIENLEGKFISAEELDVEKARITVLEANSLTSDSAIIKDLQAGVTKTNTLIFGSASGDTIQTSFSNSVIAQLGDAQIKSAMIENISAAKITGLDLNTSKFTVHSEDGKSLWTDNTILIRDGSNVPRVQIGKDATGDYSMYVWNSAGQLMFDALGVTADGITRQIIRNDIVANDADIHAAKLNLESLFGAINDDTSYTLKSSKIYLDDEKQTLDVSFKVMKSTVNGLQSTQTSQGTEISAIQGQISSKIWQQDIVKAIDSVQVGGRNLIQAKYIINFQGTTDITKFITSGTIRHTDTHIHGGFKFDSLYCYQTNTEYTLSGYITITSGTVENFYVFNGKKHIFKSFSIDGKAYTSPFDLSVTEANDVLNDGNKHYFELHFVTASEILEDTGSKYTYIQVNKYSETEVAYEIIGLKLEKGNKATDWSPAPEDTEGEITSLNTRYSEITSTIDNITLTVANVDAKFANYSTTAEVQSAIDIKANEINLSVGEMYTTKTEFNNLNVGGTNLLPDTNVNTLNAVAGDKSRYWSDSAQSEYISCEFFELTDSPVKGLKYGVRQSCTTLVNQGRNLTWRDSEQIEMEDGEEYTLSCYARIVSGASATLRFRFYKTGFQSYEVEINNTEWKRISKTIKVNKATLGDDYCFIGPGGLTGKTIATVELCGFKLERGNKATEWTPAPGDIDASITEVDSKFANYSTTIAMQSAIDAKADVINLFVSETYTTKTEFSNLEIGGRNLFIDTKIMNPQKGGCYFSTNTTSAIGDDGFTIVNLPASGAWDCVNVYLAEPIGEVEGKEMTLSFDAKSDYLTTQGSNWILYAAIFDDSNGRCKMKAISYLSVASSGGKKYFNTQDYVDGEWVRVKITFELPFVSEMSASTSSKAPTKYGIQIFNKNTNTLYPIQLRKFKMEKGNKATDWSPAPEDAETEIIATKAAIELTSEKISWLVESGTSSSDFTLTDRMAQLTAQKIKLNGYLEVDGNMLVDGAITADKLATDAIKSRNFAIDATTGNITQGMYINLQDGTLNSRYVSWDNKGKLKATSVDLSGNINATTGAIGNWVLDDDGYLYAKTLVGTTTAGTVYKTYLKASSGSYDSVVIGSSIASASNEDSAEWMFRINADGTFITRGQLSVYSADGITTTGPITTTKNMSCNGGVYINGKAEIRNNGIELFHTTPFIDFHYDNSTSDYTARIIESSSGKLTVYNSISNASDRRLKQDICNLDRRYINALKLFKPVSYRFIKGSDDLNLGFIAQDVKKALIDSGITDLPLISTDDNGIYSLDYSQITALNTLGHLDHEKRIQQLENELATANAIIQSLLLSSV